MWGETKFPVDADHGSTGAHGGAYCVIPGSGNIASYSATAQEFRFEYRRAYRKPIRHLLTYTHPQYENMFKEVHSTMYLITRRGF